jgi:3-deoxy-D-arabino-heptulosonate 7-phosphate (DAHP) synthase
MSMSLRLLAVSAAFAFVGAAYAGPQASTTAKTLTPSQQHMADCSHQNAGKKGDDYKSAVSACMKGDTAPPAKKLTPSQQRMADCSHQNAGKKGDDYKNAVSACMKTH